MNAITFRSKRALEVPKTVERETKSELEGVEEEREVFAEAYREEKKIEEP